MGIERWVSVRKKEGQNELWLAPAFADMASTGFSEGLRLLGKSFAPGAETDQALSSLAPFFARLEDALLEKPGPWETWALRYMSMEQPGYQGHDYLRLVPGSVDLEGAGWPHGVSLFQEGLVFADRKQALAKVAEIANFMNGVAEAFRQHPSMAR